MRDPQRFWDRIARRYDEHGDEKRAVLLETIAYIERHLESEDRVLDFACGTGEKALGVAEAVRSIHGIDLSPAMIERACAKARDRRVENAQFSRTDLFDPTLEPGSYDAVLAFYILHLVDEPTRVLARIRELLKPGGRLICETPCLGESSAFVGWLLALVGKLGVLPRVHCFGVADLEAAITRASSFELVVSQRVGKSRTHLFVVARKGRTASQASILTEAT